ncbi:hypothetical protein GCM10028805_48690 [Spirosoma harenae]
MKNNFRKQIQEITDHIRVIGEEIYLLPKPDQLPPNSSNKDIEMELARFGISIDKSDLKSLLSLYIYLNFYVLPFKKAQECKETALLAPDNGTVSGITYEEATGIRIDYWVDSYWKYAKPESDHQYPTKQALRKGSQGQWVGNGEYVESNLIIFDDDPILNIHQQTHEFAVGSRVGNYNWIYGKNLPYYDDNKGSVRFYFHLVPFRYSAALLAREIQQGFDLYEVPFTFKFLAFEEDYLCRSDTAVLYVSKKYLYVVIHLLANIYSLFRGATFKHSQPVLESETPQFTYQLGYGISFGENPENNDSFGFNRCKILADALFRSKAETSEGRLNDVLEFLEDEKGFHVDEFYKNPDSRTDYNFFFKLFHNIVIENLRTGRRKDDKQFRDDALKWNGYRRIKIRLSDEAEWFGQPGVYRRKYLVAAVRIAIRLCREAVWYPVSVDGTDQTDVSIWKCNWLSFQPFESNSEERGYQYQMLSNFGGAEVGTESVQIFLAKIYVNYYESLLFKNTAKWADVSFGEADPDTNKLLWGDENIRLAWAYLQLPENAEERKRFIDDLKKKRELTREQLDFIYANELTKEQVERLADFIIERFIDLGRPLGNGYYTEDPKTRELFSANKRYGLAGLGEFFLKVYEL